VRCWTSPRRPGRTRGRRGGQWGERRRGGRTARGSWRRPCCPQTPAGRPTPYACSSIPCLQTGEWRSYTLLILSTTPVTGYRLCNLLQGLSVVSVSLQMQLLFISVVAQIGYMCCGESIPFSYFSDHDVCTHLV
jgi:hypothetical protein